MGGVVASECRQTAEDVRLQSSAALEKQAASAISVWIAEYLCDFECPLAHSPVPSRSSPAAVILENGGDVLKFAGDALLAVWRCSRVESDQQLLKVIEVCVAIQAWADRDRARHEATLRLKLGVSSGSIFLQHFGSISGLRREFMATGPAIRDVAECQQRLKPGQIVLSPSAADELSNHVVVEDAGDGFALVKSLNRRPTTSQAARDVAEAQAARSHGRQGETQAAVVRRRSSDDMLLSRRHSGGKMEAKGSLWDFLVNFGNNAQPSSGLVTPAPSASFISASPSAADVPVASSPAGEETLRQ